jgi:hypothetical protein
MSWLWICITYDNSYKNVSSGRWVYGDQRLVQKLAYRLMNSAWFVLHVFLVKGWNH